MSESYPQNLIDVTFSQFCVCYFPAPHTYISIFFLSKPPTSIKECLLITIFEYFYVSVRKNRKQDGVFCLGMTYEHGCYYQCSCKRESCSALKFRPAYPKCEPHKRNRHGIATKSGVYCTTQDKDNTDTIQPPE